MKIVSYRLNQHPGLYRIGFIDVDHGVIVDLQEVFREMQKSKGELEEAYAAENLLPSDPSDFYKLGQLGIDRAVASYQFYIVNKNDTQSYKRENVILGPPVPNPSKIICVGKNYADHVAEMKSDIPEYPVLFAKFNNALIGPDDSIMKSYITDKLDYEAELAVVIGKEASSVSEEQALEYVAGYSIGNDVSARDLQKRTPQWLQGKSLDKSTPIGPWLVTKEELVDPSKLNVKSFVNGQLRQSSNTKHLIFNVPYLVAFISNIMTLNPGDIILTGTPDGVGFAMKPPQFLKDGDIVKLEIEGIGVLENRVEE
ncbi:fumarylacetoacetate hydrolase family protein [Aquibacillus kalidii]|uniref:fumarylacetoacetate hydrolase family protein n=1 Tax=Aquibacillus kalidii TaxID=2762597 RepID=UPI0016440CE1|nr:fumarylacetoacetate hydrolase family protein [Aquibacillus kalidii]